MTDTAALMAAGRRLRPDWQKPERYFEERSELVAELHRIAQADPHGSHTQKSQRHKP